LYQIGDVVSIPAFLATPCLKPIPGVEACVQEASQECGIMGHLSRRAVGDDAFERLEPGIDELETGNGVVVEHRRDDGLGAG